MDFFAQKCLQKKSTLSRSDCIYEIIFIFVIQILKLIQHCSLNRDQEALLTWIAKKPLLNLGPFIWAKSSFLSRCLLFMDKFNSSSSNSSESVIYQIWTIRFVSHTQYETRVKVTSLPKLVRSISAKLTNNSEFFSKYSLINKQIKKIKLQNYSNCKRLKTQYSVTPGTTALCSIF